jgi:hypothetical protein
MILFRCAPALFFAPPAPRLWPERRLERVFQMTKSPHAHSDLAGDASI